MNRPNQRRKSITGNYLFDNAETKLSLTDKPRPAVGKQGLLFFDINNIENASESVARLPDPNQTIFSHFSFYRRLWEYIVFIVAASPLIEVSFVSIFVEKYPFWAIVPSLIFDLIFMVDLYIVTHTSYLSHGVLVYDRKRIYLHYGKLSIAIHIIASLPISWACVFVQGWWKYVLLYLTRLLRLRRAIHASETLNRRLIYYSWMSAMLPTMFLLFSLIHLFACLFYLCAVFEGLENSWVAILGWDYLSPEQHYVVSVYFVMTTILTIGFGDMTPQTSSETILVIFIQLIGVFSNAYIIGIFVSFLMDNLAATFLHHYSSLVDFLKFKQVPVDLRVEIYHYFQYKWRQNHGSGDPNTVYKYVPETIRNHCKMDMCHKCLMKIGMFNMASQNFRISLANILKTREYIPDEYIFKQNDILSDIILLKSGVVDVYVEGVKFTTTTCDAFGELELFIDQPRRSTVKAVTYVTGWTLSREDFQVAIGSRPDLRDEILNIVKMLFPDHYKEVRRLLSKQALDLLLLNEASESEYSDDSEIAMNLQNSSDSESSGINMI